MGIKRVRSNLMDYEVGKEGVAIIELTNHGNVNKTIYEVTFQDGKYLFAGFQEHEIEHEEIDEQMSIFEYL